MIYREFKRIGRTNRTLQGQPYLKKNCLPEGDSLFHSDEQPDLNLENDHTNKTGHNLKANSSISVL